MNLFDFIIIAALITGIALAVRAMVKSRKKGCCGCCRGCNGCGSKFGE